MAVTGLQEGKGWRRGVGVGWGWGGELLVMEGPSHEKKKHKGQNVDSPSSYNSLTFPMSTWFARALCEIALDECDLQITSVMCVHCISWWILFSFFCCVLFSPSLSDGHFIWPHSKDEHWQVIRISKLVMLRGSVSIIEEHFCTLIWSHINHQAPHDRNYIKPFFH